MTLAGSIDEGAVFGGLFLDLVLRSGGLNDVVEAILASKAVNFGQFRTWCNANRPGIATVLDDVVGTWEL